MKTVVRVIGAAALVIMLASPALPATAQPVVTFTLLTELPTQLAVGESCTIQVGAPITFGTES